MACRAEDWVFIEAASRDRVSRSRFSEGGLLGHRANMGPVTLFQRLHGMGGALAVKQRGPKGPRSGSGELAVVKRPVP